MLDIHSPKVTKKSKQRLQQWFTSRQIKIKVHYHSLINNILIASTYPSFSVCFASFAQLSFSSHRPIKMCSHPTSLERKLDVEEKRVIYAYNWWKRRPLRKIWLWNDLTFTDVTSACEVSIVDWYARFQFAEGKGGSCSMKKIKC